MIRVLGIDGVMTFRNREDVYEIRLGDENTKRIEFVPMGAGATREFAQEFAGKLDGALLRLGVGK